ncbi:hypothetical protein R1T16_13695 [Flavobacterium sp. DG1-102-2]|uniref:hypothetical protein n=1 Tax=Flavobacterium sp. DG1-102-2 TaxID=3081663 RepID=UPI002948EB68|nr:hypothetical protein [Flavobacterium sp. DG1-102-2]MDV6169484.1 hypothetical protein [Flavobacterium sp. DG1-102-2]
MKNVVKLGLALAVFLTAFGVRANDADFSVSVRSGLGKLINFSINNTKAHVSITSKDGDVLFEENIKAKDGKISRTYNLTAFPAGNYYLEAENGTKVARYEIKIDGKSASVSEKAIAEVLKPVLTFNEGIVSLNIKDTNNTPVEVKLYDENNVELYNETFTGANLSKKFDTKKINAEKVTFVMKYNNKMFVETIAAR